jgi:glycosyltransferase involved in cell wall biosynthesis
MPMRFLILTQYYPPEVGAAQVRLSATVRELVRLGHEVEVVTGMPNYPEGRTQAGYRGRAAMTERRDGVTIRRTWLVAAQGRGMRRMLNYISFAFTCVAGLLASTRPDVVFVESPPPLVAIPGWAFARFWRSTFVLNVSDLWPDTAVELGVTRAGLVLRLAARLEKWAYSRADYINIVTEEWAETLVGDKDVPQGKVLLLPNGVDPEYFAPRPPDEALIDALGVRGNKLVLCAGTVGYAAGLDVVISAAELLKDCPISFVFAGGGSERQRLEQDARKRGLTNVVFLGPRPVGDMSALYSLASVALVTLLDRPLFRGMRPARLTVAMASGVPVICNAHGTAARIVQDAQAGIVVAPEDPGALADAIVSLTADHESARQMGINGRRYVERSFSWERLVSSWHKQLTRRMGKN